MGALVALIGEHQLARGDIRSLDVLDVALAHGLRDRVGIDYFTFDGLVVGTERSGGDADDLCVGEVVKDVLPARRNVMLALVDDDQ